MFAWSNGPQSQRQSVQSAEQVVGCPLRLAGGFDASDLTGQCAEDRVAFKTGQALPGAVVHTEPEGQMVGGPAVHIEAVGVRVVALIAVG
jgi:hypothetical protein